MDASVNRIKSSENERALLVSLLLPTDNLFSSKESLHELKFLVKTAGAHVIGTEKVRRQKIDSSFVVGRGKLAEIQNFIREERITLLVFDLNIIKPAQVRNLEEYLNCRVVGRTEIILEIFALRAKSAEATLQVELAQLKYILPRLKGMGGVLSRTGGGIGTRGPGEKMLETDRRHIQHRISVLKKKLSKIQKNRWQQQKRRQQMMICSIVGYTNAGKSTLLNCLAKDDLFVEDRLFATLDSFTRKVYLDSTTTLLMTDTIGFIRNLPADLIYTFDSTLKDIQQADFILHVVDVSSYDLEGKMKTVNWELSRLECLNKPQIIFFNKADLLEDQKALQTLADGHDYIVGSATKDLGIAELKNLLGKYYNLVKKDYSKRGLDEV